MPELPRIISVDDHIVEPRNLWQDRLPAKYRDRGPRVERRFLRGNAIECYQLERFGITK